MGGGVYLQSVFFKSGRMSRCLSVVASVVSSSSLHLGQHLGDHSRRQHLDDARSSAMLAPSAAAHDAATPAALAGVG